MKFKAKWLDWRALAKDLSNGLNKLTVADNFRSDEFRWKTWSPKFKSGGTMTISNVLVTRSQYMIVREICWFQLRFLCDLSGTAETTIYVSNPVPAIFAEGDSNSPWYPFTVLTFEPGTYIGTHTAFVLNNGDFAIRARDDWTVNYQLVAGVECRAHGFYRCEG